jgi:hypothetical protein
VGNAAENKKEVKTAWFSPPGVGGVLQDKSFDGTAAFPAREVCNLTRVMLSAVRARDLPPKGSSLPLCNTAIRACQPQNIYPASLFLRQPSLAIYSNSVSLNNLSLNMDFFIPPVRMFSTTGTSGLR